MRILVSGSTGLIGSALVPLLKAAGHEVSGLVRGVPSALKGEVHWSPTAGKLDTAPIEETEVVIHLAGENVAGRWSEEKKRNILESRVKGTTLLSETIARLMPLPLTLLCASGIGVYGDRGDERLAENSTSGQGFLAEVCQQWEAATEVARGHGIRVVFLRFGVVLSSQGGALKKMLLPFKLGLGGKIGGGQQYMSWIDIDDAVGAILHAMEKPSMEGPVNVVAPNAVPNLEFTQTLGRVLGRPTVLPMPAFAARLAFGEMANDLLLSSQRVAPQKLQQSGYSFKYSTLEASLRHVLGK